MNLYIERVQRSWYKVLKSKIKILINITSILIKKAEMKGNERAKKRNIEVKKTRSKLNTGSRILNV
jgi:hypothetical protein